MPRDRDGGEPRDVLERKAELRDRVWTRMEEAGVDRFPGARGRIPNFSGAEAAADRLGRSVVWREAGALKANPDSPQWPVRQRALEDGKIVYMAVPKLADDEPFLLLDPGALDVPARKASSIKGASREGRRVGVDRVRSLDAVVTGCVAASPDGARLGKGGGFSDLEYAVAREAGLVDDGTPVVTTVHETQLVPEGEIPMTEHDIRLDLVVTPDRAIETSGGGGGPSGVDWGLLTEEKIRSIPLLERLRAEASAGT